MDHAKDYQAYPLLVIKKNLLSSVLSKETTKYCRLSAWSCNAFGANLSLSAQVTLISRQEGHGLGSKAQEINNRMVNINLFDDIYASQKTN